MFANKSFQDSRFQIPGVNSPAKMLFFLFVIFPIAQLQELVNLARIC